MPLARAPQPSFAELTLPLLRAAAPAGYQPFVALLVDDAHALRAQRLARHESDAAAKAGYEAQAAGLVPRLRALYAMGDLVAHVSAEDQRAERLTFGAEARRWQLLRTPLKVMRSLAPGEHAPKRLFGSTRHVGFLGNGQTATNHQAITWFLTHCWPEMRRRQPQLRLVSVRVLVDVRQPLLQHRQLSPNAARST